MKAVFESPLAEGAAPTPAVFSISESPEFVCEWGILPVESSVPAPAVGLPFFPYPSHRATLSSHEHIVGPLVVLQ